MHVLSLLSVPNISAYVDLKWALPMCSFTVRYFHSHFCRRRAGKFDLKSRWQVSFYLSLSPKTVWIVWHALNVIVGVYKCHADLDTEQAPD